MSVSQIPSTGSWIMPVSELAACNAEYSGSVTSTIPKSSTDSLGAHQLVTASCSTFEHITSLPDRANAADSVAPDVNMISAPTAPMASAILILASSISAFAARPSK